ncbi:uncharacterized protein C2orf81 homolog [Grus americana]|uniref:uncharacterized protein C2orf81 homolog n=1 Tax=Grus americana TaxID=9117 RepID=UPI002407A51D|nr:uncharacterized protein C2orf81 homolog [Grus americana]
MAEKIPPRERAAASKSRGDKSRPPTAAAAAAAAARPDVVPGRLPEAEWLCLRAAGRGDAEAGDILAELLARVMEQCRRAGAARRRVPFAVGQARVALLQIARWRFPVRDEGETDPEGDGAWREDEEPEPRAGDSWAQGSVPVLRLRPSPPPDEGEVSGARTPWRHGRQDPPAAAEAGAPPAQPPCPGRVPATGPGPPAPGLSRPQLPPDAAAVSPRPPRGKPPRARPPLPGPPAPCPPPGPSRGAVEGSGVAGAGRRAPQPPPSCSSLGTARPGVRPEGSGTVPGVPRLGPSSRPERWVRPRVEVLDPGAEAEVPACPQGARGRSRGPESGSSWLSRGPWAVGGAQLQPPPPGSPQPPSPPPRQLGSLLDSIRLAPGVTIRWGGSVRHGPRIPAHGEEDEETGEAKRDLRPIRPAVPFPAIAARQVTDDGER